MSESPWDCQSCGACCVAAGVVMVEYGSPDWFVENPDTTPKRLTATVRNVMGFGSWEADNGTRIMKREADGRCVALRGEVGKEVSCSCYAKRPAICREFTPGSPGCIKARAAVALKRVEPCP